MFGLTEKLLKLIREALAQFPEIEQAIFFGSRSMGNSKNGSDVDIAIKGRGVTVSTVTSLHRILEQDLPLPYLFDIVHYERITNSDLKEHIDQHGQQLYPE
jgi:uncharacterized protein